jgi:hypothetical protein
MTLPANRLPGRHDGAEGLLALADRYTPEEVFDMIVMCRTARSRELDEAGSALTRLAQRMVDKEMDKSNVDYDTARRAVAGRLGYTEPGSRSNFYKVLAGGRPPEKRPHSKIRGGSR